jgi:hypothetical protein
MPTQPPAVKDLSPLCLNSAKMFPFIVKMPFRDIADAGNIHRNNT